MKRLTDIKILVLSYLNQKSKDFAIPLLKGLGTEVGVVGVVRFKSTQVQTFEKVRSLKHGMRPGPYLSPRLNLGQRQDLLGCLVNVFGLLKFWSITLLSVESYGGPRVSNLPD